MAEERITLKPMTREAYHEYFKEYQNDPELYIDKKGFVPYVYDKERVDRYVDKQFDLGRKCFAVTLDGEAVGEVIIKDIVPGESAVLSISMKNDDCKGKGFGTEAERLAVEYVFYGLDLPVLYADTLITNERSGHVLEKVGFRLIKTEGDFRYYRIDRPDPV